ncbi:hypothetical protein H6775_01210 [Candidatus Nomurabacteria bacterium]|nr:hypothetical protein [Candidatus Nomurabacteria bacterium]
MEETNETTQVEMNNQKTGGIGPVVGSIIILLVILIGAYYFWNKVQDKRLQNQTQQEQTLSESDEVSDIEADLNTTANFDDIESDLDAMDQEFTN